MLPNDLNEAKKYLKELEGELSIKFRARNDQIDRWRDLYFLEHHKDRQPAPGETLITTNKPTNVVDLTVGILSSNEMRIRAYTVGMETEETQHGASCVEKFCKGILYITNEKQEIELEALVNTCVARDGWACIFGYWDPEIPLKEQAYGELPATLQLIDIKEIFYETGGPKGGYRSFIRSCTRTVRDIEDEWDIELDGYEGRKKKEINVKYVDYWGWTKAQEEPSIDEMGNEVEGKSHWVIENAILADDKHWVMEPRYVPQYRELPFTLFPGRLTSDSKPEKAALSVLFPIEKAVKDLEAQLSHHRRITTLYASLPPIVETALGVDTPEIDAALGNALNLKAGDKVYFPTWPGSPPDVDKDMAYTNSEIQEGSYQSSEYGAPAGSSGYALSLSNDAGRIRLQQFQRNLERSWAIVFRKMLSLAAQFAPAQNLPVYGRLNGKPFVLGITGGDMLGYRIDVEIKPQFPQDETRKTTVAAQLKAQDLLSDETIQERYLDVDYPDVEMDRKLKQIALQNPDLMRAKIMQVLQEQAPELMAMMMPQPTAQQNQQAVQPTAQQNQMAEATMGQPPMPQSPGQLPPSAVMPQEMVGIGPPQAAGMPAPGQFNPELAAVMRMMGGLPGVG